MANTEKNTDKNSDKLKALRLTIDKIDKDFGKGSVMMMNERSTGTTGSYFNGFHRA